ncbi:unnamed protein product [Brugia timori]|uniref:alpha-1,2-Mannosidase n=1 Tax=Brugia timori TaxID=42155 RepID=A0A0R3QWF9_9BILA|nr:unnamed protein product [Brugia timori]
MEVLKHVWEGYKKYACGYDHLKPVTKSYNDWFDLKLTIVDLISTVVDINCHYYGTSCSKFYEIF